MNLDLSFQTTVRVRYSETDQMGYCYYGNYAQFFEIGRVEALRSVGMSYKEMEDRGIMLPVSEYSCKYIGPAYYDDELTIITKITSVIGPRLRFDYEVISPKGKVINKAYTILVFVSKKNMRPIQAPDNFIQILSSYEK